MKLGFINFLCKTFTIDLFDFLDLKELKLECELPTVDLSSYDGPILDEDNIEIVDESLVNEEHLHYYANKYIKTKIRNILDSDTINTTLSYKKNVRLINLDAPEIGTDNERFGLISHELVKSIIDIEEDILIYFDANVDIYDDYNRFLGHIFIKYNYKYVSLNYIILRYGLGYEDFRNGIKGLYIKELVEASSKAKEECVGVYNYKFIDPYYDYNNKRSMRLFYILNTKLGYVNISDYELDNISFYNDEAYATKIRNKEEVSYIKKLIRVRYDKMFTDVIEIYDFDKNKLY